LHGVEFETGSRFDLLSCETRAEEIAIQAADTFAFTREKAAVENHLSVFGEHVDDFFIQTLIEMGCIRLVQTADRIRVFKHSDLVRQFCIESAVRF